MADQFPSEPGHMRHQQVWRARLHTRIQRYKYLIASKWWIPLLAVLVGLGVQSFLWSREKPLYISTGQMIVNVRLSIPEGSVYTEELSNFLGTQSALMQSGVVMNRAHARVLAQLTNATFQAVQLRATVMPKTTIFMLQATGDDASYTQAFLQQCMDQYVNLKREMIEQTSDTTLAGLTEEVLRLQKELKKTDDEMTAFQSSNSVVLLAEQGASAVSYLGALNQRLAGLRSEYELLKSLTLDQNLERQPHGVAEMPSASELLTSKASPGATDPAKLDYFRARQQILLLKAEREELGQNLRPKHPKVVAITEEIDRRERVLGMLRQQSSEQLESLKNSLSLQIKGLERDVQEWEAKSLEASRKTAEFQRLKANSSRIQALYDRLLGTMQTLDVNKGISPESVTIMEKASPARPSKPQLSMMLLKGALVGLALAVGLLLLIDRLDDRISTFAELQELFDEEVFAQVPREKAAGRRKGKPLVCQEDSPHAFVEAHRNLRSSLLYTGEGAGKRKTLLITSSVPNEGKSITAANMAAMMATSGSRVLLVDADMRKGMLHTDFGLKAEPGLSEVLTHKLAFEEAVQSVAVPNLYVLPRGAVTHRASELFLNPFTQSFLQAATAQYDYVILDTAPVMAADDVSSLAPQVDAALFVIRAEHTSARVARAALDSLYQRQVNVLGLVFNAVRPTSGGYYYYKYSDYYAKHPAGDKTGKKA